MSELQSLRAAIESASPRLADYVRPVHDSVRGQYALLDPERAVFISPSAWKIVTLCNGARTTSAVIATLKQLYPNASIEKDVLSTLAHLHQRGLISFDRKIPHQLTQTASIQKPLSLAATSLQPPLALTAELTYRCPLRCGYCSNPIELTKYPESMSVERWCLAIERCADAGVLQCSFSGGEPLLFDGLDVLIQSAQKRGMYSNLITSAWGLDAEKLKPLVDAGLGHVQVSVQHSDATLADELCGAHGAHDRKLRAMNVVSRSGIALSVNYVIHRQSASAVRAVLELARDAGAIRVELASVQSHGWALLNRSALLPSREQCEQVSEVVADFRAKNDGDMRVIFVVPDYYSDRPKPCMDGWGKKFLTITPDGTLLPCPGAHALPLAFERFDARPTIRDHWENSAVFNAFRGEQWMAEPCRSCDERATDYAGCRCQAFALTGDMTAADPTCAKSSKHSLVVAARTQAQSPDSPLVQLRTLSPKHR